MAPYACGSSAGGPAVGPAGGGTGADGTAGAAEGGPGADGRDIAESVPALSAVGTELKPAEPGIGGAASGAVASWASGEGSVAGGTGGSPASWRGGAAASSGGTSITRTGRERSLVDT